MNDPDLLPQLKSLREAFAQQVSPSGELDYAKEAKALEEIEADLAEQKYFAAQEKFEKLHNDFGYAARRLESDSGALSMFNDKKAEMKREAEEIRSRERELGMLLYHINAAAQEQARTKSGESADVLLAAAESLKRSMTFDNRYSAPDDIADYLILAAKSQQQQEKLIQEQARALQAMSEKVTALEKKLAEFEDPKPLDKPKIHPPGLHS